MTAQSLPVPPSVTCDPATGLCKPVPLPRNTALPDVKNTDSEIIYVGDPMCSWCWGISPALHQLERTARLNGIPYRIMLGGLRPDDSEQWNEQFRQFLQHHWEEVSARSGQPFGNTLFDREHFQYNTEPSCRAVVAARQLDASLASRFFELTQHRFYVLNEDPKAVDFYRPICLTLGLDFDQFSALFASEEVKAETLADFQLNRQWGISGYPTVVLRQGNQLIPVARGFATFDDMWSRVEAQLNAAE